MNYNPKQTLEYLLSAASKLYAVPFSKEFKFMKTRKFRFDYLIGTNVGLEYEGGGGRHQTFIGYANDCEKYNLAQLNGFKVFRLTPYNFKNENMDETINLISLIFKEAL